MKSKSRFSLIQLNELFVLTMMLVIMTFVFLSYRFIPLRVYLLFTINIVIFMACSALGASRGFLLGMLAAFFYGMFLIYEVAFLGTALCGFSDYFWLFSFSVSAWAAGRLVEETDAFIRNLQAEYDYVKKHGVLDEETGFSNSRRFAENLRQEKGRHERYGTPFTLMMIKLLHYPEISRDYGEKGRRKIIGIVSSGIEKVLRVEDKKARLGGDVFGIILVNTDTEKAYLVRERLHEAIKTSDFELDGENKNMEFHYRIGIAEVGDVLEDYQELVRLAEKDMENDL